MRVERGTRLGPYEIVERIGAGGMGEVFRALDTRLDRSVAVKVLPTHLGFSPELRERFDREARAISALNHPGICTLHDVGHQDGVDYIVMELLEGETLADRLRKGALPFDQLCRYAAQIADGLDRAHRSGIVHRDLKPGNIMITRSGAKLLDFGLAKAASRAIATDAPTEHHKPLTAEGTILGTFQYMAPEQLEGSEADSRTDIFAFGAVLYEMATGRRAFDGKTRTSIIAAIVSSEPPPLSQVQPSTPPALDRIIRRCLAKEPDDRWQSARDLAAELLWIGSADQGVTDPTGARAGHNRRRAALASAVAVAGLIATGLFGYLFLRERQLRPPTLVTTSISTPAGLEFSQDGGFALSPDGTKLAFVNGAAEESARRVQIRQMATGVVSALSGTDGAQGVFWSPDSRNVAFFASGKLKRAAISGGAAQTICDAESPRGGTWSAAGTIVFTPIFRDGLFSVPASGGDPQRLTTPDLKKGETNHRWPQFLPDGRHVLFVAQRAEGSSATDPSTIEIYSLESARRHRLVRANSSPLYSQGYLLYWREGNLLAHELDPSKLRLAGDPFVVASDVAYSGNELAAVSASEAGALAYLPGLMRDSRLVWVDRAGRELGTLAENARFSNPAISPDGKQVVFGLHQASHDVWTIDAERKTRSRVTSQPGDEYGAIWSPDSSRIAYASNEPPLAVWTVKSTGTDAARLWQGENPIPRGWSRDDRVLIEFLDSKMKWGIGIFSMSDRTFRPVVQTPFTEVAPVFSPDGRSIAFMSDQTGRFEVYVHSLATTQQWQISTEGGAFPRWARDGSEIYYVTAQGRMMSVAVQLSPAFTAAPPETLFPVGLAYSEEPQYDVLDRNRFLLNKAGANSRSDMLTLIQNWTMLRKD